MAVTNLRLRMMEDGRTQRAIAQASGVQPSRISEYALGRTKMPQHHLMALALTLRCNPTDIIGDAEEIVL